jgi:hypothetical protein
MISRSASSVRYTNKDNYFRCNRLQTYVKHIPLNNDRNRVKSHGPSTCPEISPTYFEVYYIAILFHVSCNSTSGYIQINVVSVLKTLLQIKHNITDAQIYIILSNLDLGRSWFSSVVYLTTLSVAETIHHRQSCSHIGYLGLIYLSIYLSTYLPAPHSLHEDSSVL